MVLAFKDPRVPPENNQFLQEYEKWSFSVSLSFSYSGLGYWRLSVSEGESVTRSPIELRQLKKY